MNGYVCYYGHSRWECYADTLYEAKLKAIAYWRVRKRQESMISVMLVEKAGKPVAHSTAGLQ